ncbi:MAG: hypothetical protein IKY46_00010 [Clostridia bacterium]|nr:hypothetical protein [Clostridia bacterium]MBR5903707.1 hypothetical protein [Clostridia bacterium]
MLSILLNGRAIGTAELHNGVLRASCAQASGYIYRLELVGESCLSMGVMVPQNGEFVLSRSGISGKDWQYCQVLRSLPEEPLCPPLPFALSHGEDISSWDFCTDSLLRDCLSATQGVKTAVHRGERYVYFPLTTDAPCAMAPFFFCLTCFESNGKLYAAIKISGGMPAPV